jgi:Cu+-exporting ATPase
METGTLGSLLWLIIIGGFFYFMMRKGGCCGQAHSEHDQHKGHTHGGSNAGNMKDPVCAMDVKMTDAAMSREHNGQSFYFCSSQCMEKFDKDPMHYAESAQGSSQKHAGCC